jgi:hypothetical protein
MDNEISPSSSVAPKNGKWGLIIVLIVLILLGGGVAGAYSLGYLPLTEPTPTDVFRKSILSLKDLKSFSYDASFDGTMTGAVEDQTLGVPVGNVSYSFGSKGTFELVDIKNQDVRFDTTLAMKVKASDHTGSIDLSFDSNFRFVKDMVYLKLTDLDFTYAPVKVDIRAAMVEGMIKAMIEPIKGNWYSVESKEPKQVKDPQDQEEFNKIADRLIIFDYLDNLETLPSENINGMSTYHYRFSINKDKLKDILNDVEKVSSAQVRNPLVAAVIAQTAESKATTDPQFEVWFGKRDFHLYRIALRETTYSDQLSTRTITVKGKIDYSNYNKAFSIKAPATSTPSEDLLRSLSVPMR